MCLGRRRMHRGGVATTGVALPNGGALMSTTIPELRSVEVGVGSVSPAAAWTPTGRAAAAVALIGGGALWLVGDLIGFGHSGVDRAAYVAAHPALTGVGVSADMLGTALLFFAIPIWLLLGRQTITSAGLGGGGDGCVRYGRPGGDPRS